MAETHVDRLHLSRYPAHGAMHAHSHEEAWLCLLLRGGYEETIRSRQQPSMPGELLFCPAHAEHSQRFGAEGALKLLFAPDAASLDFLADRGVVLDDAPHLNASAEALGIGTRLQRELETDDDFSRMAVSGLALELIALFGRDTQERRLPGPPPWLRRVKSRLDDSPEMSFALDELAREAGRHPVHVARAFRHHYARSIGDYVRCSRGERAARMLRSTRMPLIEIALACGYAGPSQLSRAFRAAFGVTPSQYRRLAG